MGSPTSNFYLYKKPKVLLSLTPKHEIFKSNISQLLIKCLEFGVSQMDLRRGNSHNTYREQLTEYSKARTKWERKKVFSQRTAITETLVIQQYMLVFYVQHNLPKVLSKASILGTFELRLDNTSGGIFKEILPHRETELCGMTSSTVVLFDKILKNAGGKIIQIPFIHIYIIFH